MLPFLGKMKSDESNKENSSEMDYLENATVIDESTLTPEQRLGLKQAEERLERDHIFRLEKVYHVVLVTWRKMHVFNQVQLFLFFLQYSLGRDITHFPFLPSFFSSFLPLFCSICSADPFICESWLHSFIPGLDKLWPITLFSFSKIVVEYLMFL